MKETVPFDRGIARLTLPPEAAAAFAELSQSLAARSLIVWGEHCSECAYPRCYSSCAFYAPRGDLHCRRFEDGIETVADTPEGVSLTRIRFRKWGKLEGKGPASLVAAEAARKQERRDALVGAGLDKAPVPFAVTRTLAWRWNERKKATAARPSATAADAFVVETYAPGATHTFTLTFLAEDGAGMFQCAFQAGPAYGRLVVPVARIAAQVDLSRPFLVQVEPVGEAQGREIVFGLVDFASFAGEIPASVDPAVRPPVAAAGHAPAKVVVWDLDETLWSGTLAESGVEGLTLRPEAVAAIRALDERGVLQSIASKNDHAEAMTALEAFGLADFFLHPQVAWTPKSDAMARIAKALDLGLDSFVFIDDQPFERGEVEAAHPTVRTLPHTAVAGLPAHPWFNLPVTTESRRRRGMYQAEARRGAAYEDAGTDYAAFLAGCSIVLDAAPLAPADAERVYELSQRTNQLNFTGAKLGRDEVEALVKGSPNLACLTLRVADRFGDYGLVGFAVLDLAKGELAQFFMSCRVQRKRVEHAFFALAADRLKASGHAVFQVAFRRTERNKAAALMLADLGFAEPAGGEGAWTRSLAEPYPDASVVSLARPKARPKAAARAA